MCRACPAVQVPRVMTAVILLTSLRKSCNVTTRYLRNEQCGWDYDPSRMILLRMVSISLMETNLVDTWSFLASNSTTFDFNIPHESQTWLRKLLMGAQLCSYFNPSSRIIFIRGTTSYRIKYHLIDLLFFHTENTNTFDLKITHESKIWVIRWSFCTHTINTFDLEVTQKAQF